MNTLKDFLKDRSLLFALMFIVVSEGMMQMGCYRPFLKKSSYAQNVNRITDSAIKSIPSLKPNILIMGTSIAYEGISTKRLNEKIKQKGLVAQSIAIPGSELIVQELALRKVLASNPDIKYVIHVNEMHLPWVDRKSLIDSSLSMLAELDRWEARKKIEEDKYDASWKDFAFLYVRWIAYRNDIADLLLKPEKRWKEFTKERKKDTSDPYAYTNTYKQSLTPYDFNSVSDCLSKAAPGSAIPIGSDKHHLDALYKTCKLVNETKFSVEKNEHTELFKVRLTNFYRYIDAKNIKIINVYPPVNTHLDCDDNDLRQKFWDREYKDLLRNTKFDLSRVIPEDKNSDYYYDLLHLNERGMEVFTDALAESIIRYVI